VYRLGLFVRHVLRLELSVETAGNILTGTRTSESRRLPDQTGMGAMLDTRETLRTFPNLGQPIPAASEQRWTATKKPLRAVAAKPVSLSRIGADTRVGTNRSVGFGRRPRPFQSRCDGNAVAKQEGEGTGLLWQS
jgi:hypothetical protein